MDHAAEPYVQCPVGERFRPLSPYVCHKRKKDYQICALYDMSIFRKVYGAYYFTPRDGQCPCRQFLTDVQLFVHRRYPHVIEPDDVVMPAPDWLIEKFLSSPSMQKNFCSWMKGPVTHGDDQGLEEDFFVLEHIFPESEYVGFIKSFSLATPLTVLIIMVLCTALAIDPQTFEENYVVFVGLYVTSPLIAVLILNTLDFLGLSYPPVPVQTVSHEYSITRVVPATHVDMLEDYLIGDVRPTNMSFFDEPLPPRLLKVTYSQDIMPGKWVIASRGSNLMKEIYAYPGFITQVLSVLFVSLRQPVHHLAAGSRKLILQKDSYVDFETSSQVYGLSTSVNTRALDVVYASIFTRALASTSVNLSRYISLLEAVLPNTTSYVFARIVMTRQRYAHLSDYVVDPDQS